MEMTIDKYTYESHSTDDADVITIEVTDKDGEFICQYNITVENNEVTDYSGVAELDSDDILFIKALGINIDEKEFLV